MGRGIITKTVRRDGKRRFFLRRQALASTETNHSHSVTRDEEFGALSQKVELHPSDELPHVCDVSGHVDLVLLDFAEQELQSPAATRAMDEPSDVTGNGHIGDGCQETDLPAAQCRAHLISRVSRMLAVAAARTLEGKATQITLTTDYSC
jgi:hypothetical protein